MGSTVQLRSRSTRALGATMVAFSAVTLLVTAISTPAAVLSYGGPIALFGLLGWAAFWKPYVEVSDGGVLVANTLRTVHVPWPAIESVDGRYGLRLRTAYGVVTAWGASAPSGRQRLRDEVSEAAIVVERRLAELREAGHLDRPRLEQDAARTHWHQPVIAALVVLAVASLLLPRLG